MAETRNRFYKARRRAMKILSLSGYHVTSLSEGAFDIEAVREIEMRKIKICIDTVSKADDKKVRKIIMPAFCRKEIWCKKKDKTNFEIIEIQNRVNR